MRSSTPPTPASRLRPGRLLRAVACRWWGASWFSPSLCCWLCLTGSRGVPQPPQGVGVGWGRDGAAWGEQEGALGRCRQGRPELGGNLSPVTADGEQLVVHATDDGHAEVGVECGVAGKELVPVEGVDRVAGEPLGVRVRTAGVEHHLAVTDRLQDLSVVRTGVLLEGLPVEEVAAGRTGDGVEDAVEPCATLVDGCHQERDVVGEGLGDG